MKNNVEYIPIGTDGKAHAYSLYTFAMTWMADAHKTLSQAGFWRVAGKFLGERKRVARHFRHAKRPAGKVYRDPQEGYANFFINACMLRPEQELDRALIKHRLELCSVRAPSRPRLQICWQCAAVAVSRTPCSARSRLSMV